MSQDLTRLPKRATSLLVYEDKANIMSYMPDPSSSPKYAISMDPIAAAQLELKADRPHPHNYPDTLTGYRHTDFISRQKQTKTLDKNLDDSNCSLLHSTPMLKIKVLTQTVQPGERKQTNPRTDGRTDATKCIISLLR